MNMVYDGTYSTAHIQVYNRTRVLAQDSKKTRKFCRVHELCTSSKMHVKIFTARQEYSSVETRAICSSTLE